MATDLEPRTEVHLGLAVVAGFLLGVIAGLLLRDEPLVLKQETTHGDVRYDD